MYPSIITTFSYPNPTDRLNNPSHSTLENTQSSAIGQIQAVIGTQTSAVGTLFYDVRSPNSNGGGHVQTANTGGTGQTTYTKGNLLVAQGASVLSKLAPSSVSGEVLVSDTSAALGVKWGTFSQKLALKNSVVTVTTLGEQVIFSASVMGSTLGVNNAIRFTGYMPLVVSGSGPGSETMLVNMRYGGSIFAAASILGESANYTGKGVISGIIANDGSINSQFGYFQFYAAGNSWADDDVEPTASVLANAFATGISSVHSSADRALTISVQFVTNPGSVQGGSFLMEKIS